MEIKRYYVDEGGKVNIEGLALRVRETTKYKNYCNAVQNIGKFKKISALGLFIFITSLFIFIGSVGHVELMSIKEIRDTWSLSTYIVIDTIGTVLMIVGLFVLRWGYSKELICEKWINEYLEQNTAKRRR